MRLFCQSVRSVALAYFLLIFTRFSSSHADLIRQRLQERSLRTSADVIDNSITSDNEVEANAADASENKLNSNVINRDFVDQISWKCANNASCLYGLVNRVYSSYQNGETIKLGPFDLVKLPPPPVLNSSSSSRKLIGNGRGMSSFIDFIRGNAIRVPVGPMVFSVQRAEDDSNYIEIALLRKSATTGRNEGAAGKQGGGLLGGSGGGGGLGGGGLLSGGGGGGGNGGLGGRRKNHQDKKQFQMYIPLYLAATTFGWTMVAAKAVGLLTLKALALSKLAFIVAASIIVKKMMDSASEKMMYQYPEHAPYMMPYNMEYPMHSMTSELATSEMFHPSALQLAAAAPMHHQAHAGLESYGAESHLHHNVAELQNNTQVLAALNAVGLGQKVKREDALITKAKRPLVYNYVHPQNPYYRA